VADATSLFLFRAEFENLSSGQLAINYFRDRKIVSRTRHAEVTDDHGGRIRAHFRRTVSFVARYSRRVVATSGIGPASASCAPPEASKIERRCTCYSLRMMNTNTGANRLKVAASLSDDALLVRLADLAADGRGTTADLIACLAELARRKAQRGEGEGSLFQYCTQVLRLSEAATFNRTAAAYAATKFPVILDLLADGSVNLTTIRVLAPHLTPENHAGLLKEATGRTKEEVTAICRCLDPKPDVRPSVRRIPATRASAPTAPLPAVASRVEDGQPSLLLPSTGPASKMTAPPAPRRPAVEPLAADRYGVHFTVSKATREKLRRAQDLLRRQIPDGDLGTIVDQALDLLIERAEKKAFSSTKRPRASRGTKPQSRTIPAAVERAVWERDGGRCAFIGRTGRRCSETSRLEFHHRHPHGHGGEATVENIALFCRAHNDYEAELVYGRFAVMADREWLPGGVGWDRGPAGTEGNLSWDR
jgi:5-methylcytosine-specific restriction endonuclease McrA